MVTRRRALQRAALGSLGMAGAALVGARSVSAEEGKMPRFETYSADQLDAMFAERDRRLLALEHAETPAPNPTPTPIPMPPAPVPTPTPTPSPQPTAQRGLTLRQYDGIDGNWLAQTMREHAVKGVNLQFVLKDYRERDLDNAVLDRVEGALEVAEFYGAFVVPRFSYWFNDGARDYRIDAQPEQAHRHIDQLAPIINAHASNVLIIESGIIGLWGEHHYDGVPAWAQTYGERHRRLPERMALYRKQLAAWRPPLALRYATDLRAVQQVLSADEWSRLGMYCDAVLTERWEWGTYQPELDTGRWLYEAGQEPSDPEYIDNSYMQWLSRNFLNVPRIVGGEFGQGTSYDDNGLRQAVQELVGRQYRYHSYDSGNQASGIKERLQRLGLWDRLVRGVNEGW